MFKLLKYLPFAALFQDVTDKVKEAGIDKRPWYLQRTIIGSIIALVSGIIAVQFGVSITEPDKVLISDNVLQIITVIPTLYGGVLAIYGVVMKIVNAVKTKYNTPAPPPAV